SMHLPLALHDALPISALHPDFWTIASPTWAVRVCQSSIRRWDARDMEKSSCLAFGARIYYRPIEAAVRWAGLLRFEPRILETLRSEEHTSELQSRENL